MGLGASLFLIAAGAILVWGVNATVAGLNVDAIGVILMVIGIVALVLTLLLWHSWWGPGYWRRTAYVDDGPERSWYDGRSWGRRRTTYVEDDAPPPPP